MFMVKFIFDKFRSSCLEVFCKKGDLKNFAEYPRKQFCEIF